MNGKQPLAIGISCGSPQDAEKGIIQAPPNLPDWIDIPITDILGKAFQVPAFLANDANACALAEWKFGAGTGTKNMVFLTFGTGLGAGLILNGKLYEGTCGMAGESGHIRLAADGPIGYGKAGAVLADKLQGGICAVDLTSFPAPISAVINDTDPQLTYAQLVWAMGRPGDVFVGLSTSGNAQNVIYAAQAAKQRGMQVISLTGKKESPLSALANSAIRVPEQETYMVQELHLPVYHWLCAALEDALFE